ncbi:MULTISPECIES: M20 family metallopeptidase [unclassified Roseivivax]|uniref:M20 family metallopeptidase n=1 Tax=unclassified Roseivivax TaxID=2639302 RepID=UPI001267E9D5|nr:MULTISPECIES: M20/M25/M40 family metallo-hydrolase [unclassified Roseivivax]QFT48935.1 Acetylornithine deacetylase [Roseivivax sp. THAF40]QFT65089.1 Acetylornithine deacetylase [Roseivivax sp. THAF30]
MPQQQTPSFLSEAALIEQLKNFVSFPSQQTDLLEEDPKIHDFIRKCAAPRFKEVGADVHFDDHGNLIAQAGPRDAGVSLLFVAYAMTHPANRMTDPFTPRLIETAHGPAVRGRGVAEQKTALTAVLAALGQAIAEDKLKGRLTVVLTTAGETGRHDAVRAAMKNIGEMPDFACICIGTDSKIATGNKGRVDFDIHVHGKAAHSSSPWNGINALSGARHILENLETFDLGVADHPVFGPATLTPTALKTLPNATHTVPDTATITYDRRVLPGESPEEAYEALTRRIRIQEPWTLDFEQGPIMYPNELDPNGTFAKKLKAAFSRSGYKEAETFACNFALDAGFFSRAGAEAVMLGPGEVGQFHSDEESVLVQDLVGIAQVYYELICECLEAG